MHRLERFKKCGPAAVRKSWAIALEDNDMLSVNVSDQMILIREFVELQEKLIKETVSQLDPTATEYDFKDSLPPTVKVDGITWSTKAHGLGVAFSDQKAKIVVDVHVGLLDAPRAFDAWRLVQYCESLQRKKEEFKSWQAILGELAQKGLIQPHNKYENHHLLK